MHLLLLRLLRKLSILKRVDTSASLTLQGHRFKIPILKEVGMHNLMMDEFWMMDIFSRLSPNDEDVLIDIGANVGQTLLKWKAVHPKSKYVAVEPLASCINYLEKLIEINSFTNCQISEKAISDQDGKSEFYLHFPEPSDRTASLLNQEFDPIKSISIETQKFESLLKTLDISPQNIYCIKIDVEGSETEILNDMKPFLLRYKPILIIEILAIDKNRLKRTNRIIQELPYQMYRIVKNQLRLDHFQKIESVEIDTSIDQSDYLFIHNDFIGNLEI